jgi:polyisoprenyl-phosphate glycosyltransferase
MNHLTKSSTVRNVSVFELAEGEQVKTPEISFIIPAFNEEGNIMEVTRQIMEVCGPLQRSYEIVFIDDGSSDGTAAEILKCAKEAPIYFIKLSRNFGKESALTAGISRAQGQAVIIMDADLQHPLSMIPEFLEHWDNGYEMIYATRVCRKDESWVKRKLTKAFYQILSKISCVHIPPNAQDYRLLDRKVVDAILSLPEKNRFMKGIYNWVGFKTKSIPIKMQKRLNGKSTFNFRSLCKLAFTALTSFSSAPLRIWTGVGAAISILSILYAGGIVMRTLIFGAEIPGWATLTVSIMFLGGIQLISIGVLGEYIGRIFDEVKARPNFIITEEHQPNLD